MLATENSLWKTALVFTVAMLCLLCGCTPSGPRALLKGDELLRSGQPLAAINQLERARSQMPNEPLVWNLLGLAYHRSGQPQLAIQAYQRALAHDKSNRVSVAHYNLGCLFLEQTNPAAAADHLRSYTLTTNSAAGFVKLATAQLRLRRLELAEASFGSALRLEPRNAEALNGVGVVHAQKNQRDAIQYFQAALQSKPGYPPALLNAGLLAYQQPGARATARQRLKDFLATAPESSQADAVKLLVRQIEGEFTQQAASSNALASATLKSNALLAALQTTNRPTTTNQPPRIVTVATNSKPVTVTRTSFTQPLTNALRNDLARTTNPPAPAVQSNPPVVIVSLTNVSPPKVAAVEPEPVRIPEAPPVAPPAETIPQIAAQPTVPTEVKAPEESTKTGFFARLNPFRSRSKSPVTNEPPRVVVLSPQTSAVTSEAKAEFPRYAYSSPARPRSGNRAEAERATAMAIRAERAGNANDAWQHYHRAIASDPSYFEAQYNLALLAYRLGDFRQALAGCEMALALQPESVDTRYHFALALKQAGYAHDAAVELQRVLEAKPNDARAHLTLANLYAQQLNEPPKARVHYARVLELDPRNPQAATIRYWMAANP